MKQHIIIITALLALSCMFVNATNSVSLSTLQGPPRDTVTVIVNLDNDDAVSAVDITLPLGKYLTYQANSAVLSSARSNGHYISASQTGNQLRILVYNLSLTNLKGNSGELLRFNLILGKEPGSYALTPTVVLSTATASSIPTTVSDGSVTILSSKIALSATQIDFGHIPIRSTYTQSLTVSNTGTSALNISSIVLSDTAMSCPQTYTIAAGSSQSVTVTYSPMIHGATSGTMVINSNASNSKQTVNIIADPFSVNELHIKSTSGIADDTVSVYLTMNNMEPIVGMQASFRIPDGLDFVPNSFDVNPRKVNHLATSSLSGDTLTIMAYSPDNTPFTGTDDTLGSFKVRLNGASGYYYLNPVNVVLANASEVNMMSATSRGYVQIQSPRISVASQLDMGAVAVTDTGCVGLRIYNNSNVPLTVSRVTFLAEGYSVANIFPITIQGWGYDTLWVKHRPTAEDSFSVTMQIYSNDPVSRLTSVNVHGTGYEPNKYTLRGKRLNDSRYALTVEMENYSDIVALQMDIHWLDSMNTSSQAIILKPRAQTLLPMVSKIDKGTYRVALFSMGNYPLLGNSGEVFDLIYNGASEYNHTYIKVDNLIASGTKGVNKLQVKEDSLYVDIKYVDAPCDTSRGYTTGAGWYNISDTASLSATPKANHHFVAWCDGDTSQTHSFVVTDDYSCNAWFVHDSLGTNCIKPSGITVSDITSNQADISWTPGLNETLWNLQYKRSADTVWTAVNNVNSPYTLDSLLSNTSYDFRMQSDCSYDQSDWTDVSSFSTTLYCPEPTNLVVGETTDSSAHISWTAGETENAWTIQYRVAGSEAWTTINVTTNPYILNGLNDGTSYNVRLRTDCGSAFSIWTNTVTFNTSTAPGRVPFITGFENAAEDARWTIVNGNSTSNLFVIGTDEDAVATGSRALYMSNSGQYGYSTSSSTKTYAYTTLNFPAGAYNISFNWKCTGGESVYDFARVMLVPASEELLGGTGANFNYTSFPNYIYAFDPEDKNYMNYSSGWQTYTGEFSMANNAGAYNFVIMWSNDVSAGSQYPIAIDDISITTITCPRPTSVTARDILTDQATISWTPGYGETAWNVQYKAASDASWDTLSATTNSITLTGLTENTYYDVRVQADCGGGDLSDWSSDYSFATACLPVNTYPYEEGFENGTVPPNCWSQRQLYGSNSWGVSSSYVQSGSYSAYIPDLYAGTKTALTTGELFFDSLNLYKVSFWMYRGSSYQDKEDEAIHVYVASDEAADLDTATELGVVNQNYLNAPVEEATGWYQYTFDIPQGTSGSQFITFCYHNQYGTGAYIDDVSITEIPSYHFSEQQTICQGSTYTWHRRNLTESGTYYDSLVSSLGADSIYQLTLTVNATYFIAETHTINLNESYSWHNRTLTSAGAYYDSLLTGKGCDSVYQLTLTVNPVYVFPETQEICQGESYSWRDRDLSAAGVYYDSLKAGNGYDSVYMLTLTVNPKYLISDAQETCQGGSYSWRGRSLSAGGVYYDSLLTGKGCDSVYQLTLTVNPTYLITDAQEICQGETYTWRTRDLTATGVYYDSLQTGKGCDSVYQLTLTVNPTYLITEAQEICQGETYTWRTRGLTSAGVYYDSLQTGKGCDSVYQLTLTVNPTYLITDVQDICQGETYTWRTRDLTATGVYYDSLLTGKGCDSVYQLTLTVNPTYLITDAQEICQGETYTWRTRDLTATGVYYDSLQTGKGCDSVYQLTLTVNPTHLFQESMKWPSNKGNYSWRGKSIPGTGVYYDSLTTAAGCDSVFKLDITFADNYHFNEQGSICQGESYQWRGRNYSVAGTYYDSLKTVDNILDSVYQLTLTVNPTYLMTETQTICQGGSYSWRERSLTITGVYYDSLLTRNGCDSVYMLTLTVNPTYLMPETQTICQGGSYSWRGRSLTTTGVYYDSLTTDVGCDSVYQLTLTVNTSYSYSESYSICQGDSYNWHGQNLKVAGTYTDNHQTAAGCDSNYTLTLSVNPSYSYSESYSICQGDSYNWHGQNLNIAGTYTDNHQTAAGCDSNYTLTLTVNPAYSYSESYSICQGDSYNWHGQNLKAAGTYTDNHQTAAGCDSNYTLTLTVNPAYFVADTAQLQSDGSGYVWHGETYTEAGDYTDSMKTTLGCDSVFTLHLEEAEVTAVDYISTIEVTLAPNPINTDGITYIYADWEESEKQDMVVEVISTTGATIFRTKPDAFPIEIQGISAAGTYIVRIITDTGKVYTKKLIVK